MGLRFHSVLCLIIAFCNFIPVFGMLVGGFICTMIVLVTDTRLTVWFITVYLALTVLGFIFVRPRITNKEVRLTLGTTMVCVLAGYFLGRLWGAIFAIPVYVTLRGLFLRMGAKTDQKERTKRTNRPAVRSAVGAHKAVHRFQRPTGFFKKAKASVPFGTDAEIFVWTFSAQRSFSSASSKPRRTSSYFFQLCAFRLDHFCRRFGNKTFVFQLALYAADLSVVFFKLHGKPCALRLKINHIRKRDIGCGAAGDNLHSVAVRKNPLRVQLQKRPRAF